MVAPTIKTWQERMAGCERTPGLVVYSMSEEIAELRAALAVFERTSITAQLVHAHQPECIWVDILPVYQTRKP